MKKDEGGGMKDESVFSAFILHNSSLLYAVLGQLWRWALYVAVAVCTEALSDQPENL